MLRGQGAGNHTLPAMYPSLSNNMAAPQGSASLPRALSDATHEMLIRAGNRAHIEIFARLTKASAELETVKSEYTFLFQKHTTSSPFVVYRQVYKDIVAALPEAVNGARGYLNPGPSLPFPRKEDHPGVKFWTRSEYDAVIARARATTTKPSVPKRGRIKVTDEPSDKPELIEDEYGNPVSTSTAASIRECMRQHWQTLHNKGRLPPNFSAADSEVLHWFRNQMYREFPNLMLCDFHWKLDRLWKDTFSGWRPANTRTAAPMDADVSSDPEDAIDAAIDPNADQSTSGLGKRKQPAATAKPQAERLKRSKKSGKEPNAPSAPSSSRGDVVYFIYVSGAVAEFMIYTIQMILAPSGK